MIDFSEPNAPSGPVRSNGRALVEVAMCDVRSTMNARGGGGPDAAFVAGSSQCGGSPGSPHENLTLSTLG